MTTSVLLATLHSAVVSSEPRYDIAVDGCILFEKSTPTLIVSQVSCRPVMISADKSILTNLTDAIEKLLHGILHWNGER